MRPRLSKNQKRKIRGAKLLLFFQSSGFAGCCVTGFNKSSATSVYCRLSNVRPAFGSHLVLAFVVLFSVFAVSTSAAYSAQVTVEWDAVLTSDLGGYKVHYGTFSEIYDVTVDVGNWTSCTLDSLEEDETYYFAVTAYDIYGEESDFSKEKVWNSANASNDGGGGGSGGCFIETTAYGFLTVK